MVDIGKRIKQIRIELGMSQDELATILGYKSRSSINKIEKNGRNLPQDKIKLIADALHTTPSYIMGWEEVSNNVIERVKVQDNNATNNMQRRTLESVKQWYDENTYVLLINYLNCSDDGKKWLKDRSDEAIRLYPKEK